MTEQRLLPGLIGMSVHTDCAYLRYLNEPVPARAAAAAHGTNRFQAMLRTIDFRAFLDEVAHKHWSDAEKRLLAAGLDLERSGCDFLVITSNTGNTLARELASTVAIPIVDIARPSLIEARNQGLKRLGLLSTTRTADARFYQRAAADQDCEVLLPEPGVMSAIQRVIFDHLVHGVVSSADVDTVVRAVERFVERGADGVVLACTDLTLLAEAAQARCSVALLDSTALHASAAAKVAAGVLPLADLLL